jgi:methionyl aminopeptidase
VEQGAYPSPIGFFNFPKSVCVSINECILHGIPNTRPIYLGDKVNLDVCIYFDGFHGDTNLTLIYGGLDKAPTMEVRSILSLCQQGLYKAIGVCKPGA